MVRSQVFASPDSDFQLNLLPPTALIDKSDYFKALHRRAVANESIGSWFSLTASLEGKFRFRVSQSNLPLKPDFKLFRIRRL